MRLDKYPVWAPDTPDKTHISNQIHVTTKFHLCQSVGVQNSRDVYIQHELINGSSPHQLCIYFIRPYKDENTELI